jgi:hypothetical protein
MACSRGCVLGNTTAELGIHQQGNALHLIRHIRVQRAKGIGKFGE